MNWTRFYKDAVDLPALVAPSFMEPGQERQWGKPCRVIPCPGSYFPAHDEQCEMVWEEDDQGWGWFTECSCEPRARERRDEGQV